MKKKSLIIVAIILLITIIGFGVGLFIFYNMKSDLVYSEVYVEAGTSECDVSEFLKREEASAHFTDDSKFDPRVPGDYKLKIAWKMPIFGNVTNSTTLHVQDTIAPEVTLSEDTVEMYVNAQAPSAADLVESVNDVTNCTIDFAEKYDFTKDGEFDISIVVTDEAGNQTVCTVPCKVIADTTPPVINGVEPLQIAQGDAVSFKKNIEVTDDIDENPTLEVDSSEVNVDKRGVYNLTYIARDAAGNETKKTTTVKIVSAKIAEATEENVNALADEVLAEIIKDGMDQKSQAKAVFNWVVNNITYSESAGIDDLYSAAYKGMYYHVGDCTVKQKTAEVLLNRLGIKNMEIEKIRDTRGHYWLLIDIGEGWYHYDPNLQLDGTLIFYWHDADLWAYSNAHKNTHNYDPSKYPTIQ
ncbi:transglutaminase domain-containing protein [Pseudobutyrivibrio xylanivorans]|uniref:Transglutaminase-like superfamily protein n=1 Tax=Pseudobutyrivibrio xylanivorans DSM 14809 TaxID=1123012 RepID=A0A1M6KVP7_PSEXY|nr:transglutaminase domain-containing protein [Pseudobutyrivibrio xylanivorans]SHJ63045.1 Transglutaminase-like superfamily protein [Pseudobutyrivibrio xylanivorans DSM 14809]